MKKLIVVESPTKSRTLNRFLGKDFNVVATMGHIKDLPKSKLGIDLEKNFNPSYLQVKNKDKQIKELKEAAKDADLMFLATDPDREGEAISEHVKEIVLDNKLVPKDKIKRIVFHEITESAVRHAIETPGEVDKDLVEAQIARRVLDRLVGYKLSPILWKKVRRGLSAGRVQTVAVRLIVEREREIEAFNPEEYWDFFADVIEKGSKISRPEAKDELPENAFTTKLLKINDKKAKVENKKQADVVRTDLEKAGYKVVDVVKKESRQNPYPPYKTSTMTQAAANVYSWTSKKTMSVAQQLYENGLITYHRTDSTNISKEAMESVRKYIKKEFGEAYLPEKPRYYKTTSKVAQEAHEAIRPTKVAKSAIDGSGRMAKDQIKLYSLIWRRFVASQMNPIVFDQTRIDVLASADPNLYLLRATGRVVKFDGWRKILPTRRNENAPDLPDITVGSDLDLIKLNVEQKFTQPPPRFNESSLIKELERLGIGRPSTYAPTISTIQTRNYVEKEDNKFKPTAIGIAVNDFLIKNFDNIFEYSFTAGMEDDLDKVANGELDWHKMMQEFWSPLEKQLETVEDKADRVKIQTESLGKKCPKCKEGEQVVRVGRFGKFISCSRFPDCDFTDKFMEKIDMKCPDCKDGDVIVKRTRRGRQFFGCSRYPDCKFASWKNPQKKSDQDEE